MLLRERTLSAFLAGGLAKRPTMTVKVIAFILGIIAPLGVVSWVVFFH
jgi:hypothetical protein